MIFLLKAWNVLCNVTGYIIDLAVRYPLQIIIALLCLYGFWQKLQIDDIEQEYTEYKRNIQYQVDMAKVKNEVLRKQAETALNDVMATHKDSLTVEKLDRKKIEDKLKGSINEISNELNIYRSAVKLRNSTTNSVRVPTLAEDTIRSASTSGNCNETLATVVDACKVTDIDYEALYNLYKRQCDIYGCE